VPNDDSIRLHIWTNKEGTRYDKILSWEFLLDPVKCKKLTRRDKELLIKLLTKDNHK
jgi:hypothetical protein